VINLLKNNYIIITVALLLSASVSFSAEKKNDAPITKESQTKKEEIKFDIGDF